MRGPKRSIAETKKGLFYFGISLTTIGLVSLVSTFFSDGGILNGLSNLDTNFLIRAGGGLSFVLLGWFLIRIGRSSAAAPRSGDLSRERLADTEEPTAAAPVSTQPAAETTADRPSAQQADIEGKLRRLEKLRSEGLFTEEEYLRKRDELTQEEE